MRQASREQVMQGLIAARANTLMLLEPLRSEQWAVPYAAEINPFDWELGHVAWFQELWCSRHRPGENLLGSVLKDSDRWFDSARVAHATRWDLDLPSVTSLKGYLADTLDATLNGLAKVPDSEDALYFYKLALFHEQMHSEALYMTLQLLGYEVPVNVVGTMPLVDAAGFMSVEAGEVTMGSQAGSGFVFDNEKWATSQTVESFQIASQVITNEQFLAFVDDDGYKRSEFWDEGYFVKLRASSRALPRYWRRNFAGMQVQVFGRQVPLVLSHPVMHLSAYEAQAYCQWAGVSLPTEAQWQRAAQHARGFDWGRQVWEWTSSDFHALPGFSADPYKEYSAPWFGSHRVVKGASYLTNPALVNQAFRNFYLPERDDLFVGFRVCKAL